MAKKKQDDTSPAPTPPTSNGEANGHTIPTDNTSNWTDAQRARFIDEAVGTITQNEQSMRSQLFDRLLGRRRKIDEECDYPPPGADSIGLYKELYDRNPIAARVVQVLPMASWQVTPMVYETEDDDDETQFEKDWDDVSKQLASGGAQSWHAQEQGGVVWDYLRRLDILSGIGHFGILLLGIDDGRNLQDPADGAVVVANGMTLGGLVTNAAQYPDGYLDGAEGKALDALAAAPGSRDVWTHNDEHGKAQYRQVAVPPLTNEEKETLAAWKRERAVVKEIVANAFCPTGDGGGQDNTCGAGGGSGPVSEGVSAWNELKGRLSDVSYEEIDRVVADKIGKMSSKEMKDAEGQLGIVVSGKGKAARVEAFARWLKELKQVKDESSQTYMGRRTQNAVLLLNKVIDHVSEVEGTDRQYGDFGGMGMPPAGDLSGTDAQYFMPMLGKTEQPAEKASKKKRKLLFVRPFDESLVQVVRYEWNVRNPRFGQPVMYRVTLNDYSENSGMGLPMATVFVHWSRVIHVPSDDQGSSEIMGPPRMRCGLNDLLDIRKIFACSAEGYWQSCFTALSIETHPQLGGDVKINKEQMRDMMQEFRNRLRRDIFLKGMSAKTLAPVVVDPTPFILGHIEALCIKIPCPKRVFMGSERGELASSQDDSQWNDTVRARQNLRCTPRIIVPLVDRLIMLGVVSEPGEDGYVVEWPDLDSLGKLQQADLALKVTQAITAFIGGNGEAFMPIVSYMVKVLGWNEEEAVTYMEEAAKKMEEDLADSQALADEQGMVPAAPEGFEKEEQQPEPGAVKLKPGETLHPAEGGTPIAKGAPVLKKPAANEDTRTEHDVYADEVRRLEEAT